MAAHYLWLTPIAVLLVLSLVGFVGCNQFFGLDETILRTFTNSIPPDSPTSWWRLQEPAGTAAGDVAADEIGGRNGMYVEHGGPMADDPTTASPAADPIVLELGAPGLIATQNEFTSMRVHGAGVRVPFAPEHNPLQFTLEVLVLPEWDLNSAAARGRYYCVLEASNPRDDGSGLRKNQGFAIYAGPDDPSTPDTPYRWQLWVGDGTTFNQLKELSPNDGSLVTGGQSLLAATFDGAEFTLFVYREDSDIDQVKHRLIASNYVPNTSGDLTIGFTAERRSLVGPAPGPDDALYAFNGRIQEVVIYDHALIEEHIASHIIGGFDR